MLSSSPGKEIEILSRQIAYQMEYLQTIVSFEPELELGMQAAVGLKIAPSPYLSTFASYLTLDSVRPEIELLYLRSAGAATAEITQLICAVTRGSNLLLIDFF